MGTINSHSWKKHAFLFTAHKGKELVFFTLSTFVTSSTKSVQDLAQEVLGILKSLEVAWSKKQTVPNGVTLDGPSWADWRPKAGGDHKEACQTF